MKGLGKYILANNSITLGANINTNMFTSDKIY